MKEKEIVMYWIKEIMKVLNCDESMARVVRDRMILDFSEASRESFECEARFAYNLIKNI